MAVETTMDIFGLNTITCLVLLAVFLLFLRHYITGLNLPPGPPRLPIIGSIPFMLGKDPAKILAEWAEKHGYNTDIISVQLMGRTTIVLNSYEAMKELLHQDVYSGRVTTFIGDMLGWTKYGIVSSQGEKWKQRRRLALSTFRDLGMGKPLVEEKIQEEMIHLEAAIHQSLGKSFDIGPNINNAVSNVISSIVFGQRHEYSDVMFQKFLAECNNILARGGADSITLNFPFLQWIPGDLFNVKEAVKSSFKVTQDFAGGHVKRHLNAANDNAIEEDDFVYQYISQSRKRAPDDDTENVLMAATTELFLAGTETTTTTLRWAVLYMIQYPDIQTRVREEILENIGADQMPCMKHKSILPYTEATIAEVQRLGNVAPLSVPHTLLEDTQLRGYHLPKGAMVIPNLYASNMNPKDWSNPDTFDPSRFLKDEKYFKKDMNIPFGIGKRVCLGESLARMELFIFFTRLLQKFSFKDASEGNCRDVGAVTGLTRMPAPYDIIVQSN
ncbi:unnamed protein product [Owenia fusiformis]|uniref:Uncharacterized protein n=1 Tax=Owenia fusiformis TaxID=6347 RepID=A0A8J1XKM2_OWEFU|nr:unnamed protein product [Owenia fusiformis]